MASQNEKKKSKCQKGICGLLGGCLARSVGSANRQVLRTSGLFFGCHAPGLEKALNGTNSPVRRKK
jgi:hypothetical protein